MTEDLLKVINKRQLIQLIKAANKSNMHHKLACGLFDGKGNLICIGYNRVTDKRIRSIHAEEDCLTKFIRAYAPRGIKPEYVVVIRVNRRGELRLSKPCQYCTRLIDLSGIKLKVFYTTSD